ncbi:LOW QUALITY PROTEIN: hypothetical protein Cgig2_004712 [Carnegiea gigantea]|uniref:Reverse transcriptase zinc-binding domain-containing protein n=1 Tax=Carnegiea gigantea TaxID=171969 RepID=A0A9Q1JUE1_9CARY|nr:LOW QUALITY PROTEIN: hypothetical protein Cgig2_004712 [Carnegiea gigantea]
MEWSIQFPEAHVQHLQSDISDHLPILLRCKPRKSEANKRSTRFQFENMWATDLGISDVIASTWRAISASDLVDSLLLKIEKCSATLLQWNKDNFGMDGMKIRKLEAQLTNEREIRRRKELLETIREWRKREEILWRARSDYLKYGNSNTWWFRSRVTMRRVRNYIEALLDDERVLHTKPEDKLIWHYTSDGLFSVRSAYHLIVKERDGGEGESSTQNSQLWRSIWDLEFSPRIRLFAWRSCKGILPSCGSIAKRVPGFNMKCTICGHPEEIDMHALFECPLVEAIWEGSEVPLAIWGTKF